MRVVFLFWPEVEGMWESKVRKPTPILSVRSAILVFRGVMLDCRHGILVLPGSFLRVSYMKVRMLSRYSLASSVSEIHFHTSMITCLGFAFISWASFL